MTELTELPIFKALLKHILLVENKVVFIFPEIWSFIFHSLKATMSYVSN